MCHQKPHQQGTGREQQDIKLQVFTTLKNTGEGQEDADSRVDENDNREKNMKKCLVWPWLG